MHSAGWNTLNRRVVTTWAKDLFREGFLVLDTETTGIRSGYHEIIQVAVIDNHGEVLLDSLIKPQVPERLMERSAGGKSAFDIHGIMPHMLADAPEFPQVYEQLAKILKGRHVVIYNVGFDRKMIDGDCDRHTLKRIRAKKFHCAMENYAQWHGESNPYRGGYRLQSLEKACVQLHISTAARAHSALGDCLRTLEVMKRMAEA